MHDAVAAPPAGLRLVGAAFSTRTGSAVEYLLSLRAGLGAANRARGLRSALLHHAGWLVHWIEGPAEAVDRAWRAIESDPAVRHTRLLHRSEGALTLSEPVQFATLHGLEQAGDVAQRLHRLQRQDARGWAAGPAEIWYHLSAPSQVARADALAALARRDVVAVTSEDNESIDLLRSVAGRCAPPGSYQRFARADPRGRDVGAAYADIVCGAHVTRIRALSRRALSHDLVRIGLANLQSVVLLLGSRPRACASLAEGVADLLQALPHRPAAHLVGLDAESVIEAAAILGRVPGVRVTHSRPDAAGRASLDGVLGLPVGEPAPQPIDLERI
jgi:hypothetical protein